MEQYSVFDIIGPVMIGPSSSHTAGASKIGYLAYKIFGEKINKVDFILHGSFAKTYRGHGTDKALLAGIMGFTSDDSRIKNSLEIADSVGIKYRFIKDNIDDAHPNTVIINIEGENNKRLKVVGISIGGGKVRIININDIEVSFTGEYATIITHHKDQAGVVASITNTLANNNVNIAYMKVYRHSRGDKAIMILEVDNKISEEITIELRNIKAIKEVTLIDKIII